MKSGTTRYTVVWNQAGQSRPYADTIHDFEIKVEWIPYGSIDNQFVARDLNADLIMKAARGIGYNWKDNGDWADPKLQSKTKIGPGHWRFVVVEAFTD